jgi:hypothetical protein
LPYDSFDAAAEALAAANNADSTGSTEVSSEQAPQQAAPEADAGTTAPATPEVDSFANIDPNALPPELQAQYRNMQGAFTRRMQELAQKEQMYSSIGDPEIAARGVELVRALEEDPVFVHQQLSAWLESQGMTPAQAAQTASDMQQAQAAGTSEFDEFDDPDTAALRRELDELKAWRAQEENARAEQAYMAELQREEAAILQANPNYKPSDMSAIYELAFAHGGSLLRAEKAYSALRDSWASEYMEQKASVPGGLNTPATTGAAQTPTKFERLDDPALEKAALAALQASLNGE